MRKSAILLYGLLGLLFAACDATAPGSVEDGPVALSRFSTHSGAWSDFASFEAAETGLLTTQQGWDGAYVRIFGNVVPAPTAGPPLSFSDSAVIYVGIGYFPNTSHRVRLDSAVVRDGTLEVHYTEETREGCGGAAVAVSPVDAGQVPRWDGGVRFIQRDSLTVCS